MSAALDGWVARRATHMVLVATTASAVSGIWLAVWFASATDTSTLTALPLVVVVVVAGAACGAEMTRDRRGELALTRLRGGHGLRLARQLLSEPLLSLIVGAVAGAMVGIAVSAVVRDRWLHADAEERLITAPPLLAAGTTVLLIMGIVAVGMARALAKPLPEQTAARERPTGTSTWVLFGQTLVFATTAVGLYQAVANPGTSAWVVYAGPAALGLLGGIVAGRITLTLGKIASATGREHLTHSLVAGRLARTTDAGAPLLVLVAAGVIAAVSGGAAAAVDNWVDDSGRVNAGAPVVMNFDGDAATVLSVTEKVDPEGKWVMAGVRVSEDDRPNSRRVFLDTARYNRVVGGFLDATPASPASRAVSELRERSDSLPTPMVIGNGVWQVSASVGNFTRTADLVLSLEYITRTGRSTRSVDVSVEPNTSGGASTHLDDCADGCAITGISVAEGRPCTQVVEDLGECNRPAITLSELVAGQTNLLAESWQLAPSDDVEEPGELQADRSASTLTITPARQGSSRIAPPSDTTALPVLVTANTQVAAGLPVESPGGDTRPADLVGEFDVLPVVSAGGTLADLRRASRGALPTVPGAQSLVLARADTPASVLTALREAGAHEPVTAAEVGAELAARADAAQVKVGLVVAIACLLVGVLALAAPLTRMRRDRGHDEAVLRLLGVRPGIRGAATRLELIIMAIIAASTVLICGALGVAGFLSHTRLLDVPANQSPVEAGLGSTAVAIVLLATAAAACAAVVLVGSLARRTTSSRTNPVLLREEATR